MCGRFTMTRRDKTELAAQLGVPESELGDYTPRFNIAPTQPYFVLKTTYESREVILATWGLVNSWATDASQAPRTASMRDRRRCTSFPRIAMHSSGGAAWCLPTDSLSGADPRLCGSRYGFIRRVKA